METNFRKVETTKLKVETKTPKGRDTWRKVETNFRKVETNFRKVETTQPPKNEKKRKFMNLHFLNLFVSVKEPQKPLKVETTWLKVETNG